MGSEYKNRDLENATHQSSSKCCYKRPKGIKRAKVSATSIIKRNEFEQQMNLKNQLLDEKLRTNEIFEETVNSPAGFEAKESNKSINEIIGIINSVGEQYEINTSLSEKYMQPLLKQKQKLYDAYNKKRCNETPLSFDQDIYCLMEDPNEKPSKYLGNVYSRFVPSYLNGKEYAGMTMDEIKDLNNKVIAEKDGQVIAARLADKNLSAEKRESLRYEYNIAYLKNNLGLHMIKNKMYAHMLKIYKTYGYAIMTRDFLDLTKNVLEDIVNQFSTNQDAIIFSMDSKDGTLFDVENNIDDKRFVLLTEFFALARCGIVAFTKSILMMNDYDMAKQTEFPDVMGTTLMNLRGISSALASLGVPMDKSEYSKGGKDHKNSDETAKSQAGKFFKSIYENVGDKKYIDSRLKSLWDEMAPKKLRGKDKPAAYSNLVRNLSVEFDEFTKMPDCPKKKESCVDLILGLQLSRSEKGNDNQRDNANSVLRYLYSYLYKLDCKFSSKKPTKLLDRGKRLKAFKREVTSTSNGSSNKLIPITVDVNNSGDLTSALDKIVGLSNINNTNGDEKLGEFYENDDRGVKNDPITIYRPVLAVSKKKKNNKYKFDKKILNEQKKKYNKARKDLKKRGLKLGNFNVVLKMIRVLDITDEEDFLKDYVKLVEDESKSLLSTILII